MAECLACKGECESRFCELCAALARRIQCLEGAQHLESILAAIRQYRSENPEDTHQNASKAPREYLRTLLVAAQKGLSQAGIRPEPATSTPPRPARSEKKQPPRPARPRNALSASDLRQTEAKLSRLNKIVSDAKEEVTERKARLKEAGDALKTLQAKQKRLLAHVVELKERSGQTQNENAHE